MYSLGSLYTLILLHTLNITVFEYSFFVSILEVTFYCEFPLITPSHLSISLNGFLNGLIFSWNQQCFFVKLVLSASKYAIASAKFNKKKGKVLPFLSNLLQNLNYVHNNISSQKIFVFHFKCSIEGKTQHNNTNFTQLDKRQNSLLLAILKKKLSLRATMGFTLQDKVWAGTVSAVYIWQERWG